MQMSRKCSYHVHRVTALVFADFVGCSCDLHTHSTCVLRLRRRRRRHRLRRRQSLLPSVYVGVFELWRTSRLCGCVFDNTVSNGSKVNQSKVFSGSFVVFASPPLRIAEVKTTYAHCLLCKLNPPHTQLRTTRSPTQTRLSHSLHPQKQANMHYQQVSAPCLQILELWT